MKIETIVDNDSEFALFFILFRISAHAKRNRGVRLFDCALNQIITVCSLYEVLPNMISKTTFTVFSGV